jgi:UDP-N-acetylmuramoyl-tripeptide--D-alanyl-D-alanine ligase
MLDICVKDIVEATGGALLCGDENVKIQNVCIDSKLIQEGDLFVPIIGERVDAHRFIEGALEKGAATLTSEHSTMDSDKPYIRVDDTVEALQKLGRFVRDKCHMPVIGVTGSVGKTTTREMISHALAACTQVYHTEGNLNSQVGVPITLFRMNPDAKASVIEMGISEPGQMEVLSNLVRPNICVVTVIGVAHIEYMKTQENIRHEKLSIVNHMNPGGALFLNGDDRLLAELKGDTCVPNTFFYGTEDWCDYRAENIHMENFQYVYDYVHGDKRIKVTLNALGRHNVGNSLVGMAIADYMGMDVEKAAASFAEFKGLRQKVYRVPDKYTIIDDTYNASPDSMKASIDVISDMECTGKKLVVLGDMFELGENSEQYHTDIGHYLAGKNIDELIVVGELSQFIMKAVQETDSNIKCYSFKDNGEVALYLLSVMQPEDVVLLKGSNGMHLNEIVANILG